MRWLQRNAVLVAVFASWTCLPSVTEAGWLTLTSGAGGSARPTDATDVWYGSSSTPSLVAIDALSGAGTVQAVTGGGTAFFTGLGVPVLLNLSDGSAYLAGGSPPAGATDRGPEGAPASAAPQAGLPIPDGYSRLGVALAPDGSGAWVLTASVLGSDGEGLGSGSVVVPESGWWVLGLGAGTGPQPAPGPLPEPVPPPTTEPVPTPAILPTPGVPEPGAMALAASGVALVLPWARRSTRRR